MGLEQVEVGLGMPLLLCQSLSTGQPTQVEDAHVIIAHSLCVAIRAQLRAEGLAVAEKPSWKVEETIAELVADLDL